MNTWTSAATVKQTTCLCRDTGGKGTLPAQHTTFNTIDNWAIKTPPNQKGKGPERKGYRVMARNMYTIHSVTHSHTLHRGTRARICWVAWYTDLGGKKDGTVSFVMSCLFPPPLVLFVSGHWANEAGRATMWHCAEAWELCRFRKKEKPCFQRLHRWEVKLSCQHVQRGSGCVFFDWHETSLSSCSDQCLTVRLVKQAACFCAATQTLLLRFAGI